MAVLLVAGAALVAGLAVTRQSNSPSGRTPTTPPEKVCAIDPANGEAAITAAISSCPDGTGSAPTVVRFPPGRSYTQANKIEVRDRNNLVIDGNGSTFTTTANGSTTKAVNGNWVLLRGTNITLKAMTAIGSFDLPGPRSLAAAAADPRFTDATMSYGVYGTEGAWLVDVKGFNAWGDGVTMGPAQYVDAGQPGPARFASNVHIIRMEARKTLRHCWSPTSGVGVWIEDSTCTDAWYVGLDAETDNQDQPLRDHHYLRNTFDGFNLGGLVVPVPGKKGGAPVGDIEIRGNRFLTPPDVQCNQTLHIGTYPDIGPDHEFTNIRVEDNELRTYTRAITLDHVNGGAIRNNRITQLRLPAEATVLQYCAEDRQIIVTSSTGVVVERNGP